MKLEVCDICGATLHPQSKRDLRGAMSVLLGAESVCEECAEKAQKMDVRQIMMARIKRGYTNAF